MFLFKQFLKGLILPPAIWLILLAAVLVFWNRRWARKLLFATVVIVLFLHSGLVSQALQYSLESKYQPLINCREAGPYEAIVVLTSTAILPGGLIPQPTMDLASFRRLDAALTLYRCDPKPVIISGGFVDPLETPQDVNTVVCDYLIRWGVPAGRIIQESSSRDTFENAIEVGKILRQKGWRRYLLVTSAAHMPRSMLAFRAVAPEPIAAPADFRVGRVPLSPLHFFPTENAAVNSYIALHELLGLVNYRWRSWRHKW